MRRDSGEFISVYVRMVIMPAVDTGVPGVVLITMPEGACSA